MYSDVGQGSFGVRLSLSYTIDLLDVTLGIPDVHIDVLGKVADGPIRDFPRLPAGGQVGCLPRVGVSGRHKVGIIFT